MPVQEQSAQMTAGEPSENAAANIIADTRVVQSAKSGLRAAWLPFGAHLHSVTLPDGTQILAQYSEPEAYQGGQPYLGSLIGRVANRIGDATFTVDDTRVSVTSNENGHALHGGPDGFDRQLWEVSREGDELVFRHTSPAGHQGYPGNLDVMIRTTVSGNELRVRFIAYTDAPTPVNLTQHGYWNPAGLFDAPIDRLTLSSPADRYTAVGEDQLPTGDILSVERTLYDFRTARPIGPDVLDVNLLVPGDGLREMARLSDGTRSLTVLSDYPGLQLFSGESLGGVPGLSPRGALAIEPQYPPDAVNRPVDGQDIILRPGEVYRHMIIYRFDGPDFQTPAAQDAPQ
jgi:aldose 1-epimerase